jgi:hypothetical protein
VHPHHADSLYEVAVFTRQDLQAILDTTRNNVQQIQQPNNVRTPGGIQCQWCVAKRVCKEYKALQAQTEQEIADEIEDYGFTALIRRTPKQRGDHVRRLKEYMTNAKALIDQYVELAIKNDDAVDGYTLARKMTRSITNEAQALEIVRRSFGDDVLYEALHLSLVDLEKLLAKNKKAYPTAKEAKAAVQRALSPVLRFTKSESYLREARSI